MNARRANLSKYFEAISKLRPTRYPNDTNEKDHTVSPIRKQNKTLRSFI
jgi:hypothetical protein